MKLTASIVQKAIRGDHRIDQNIDLDEAGVAIVHLEDGWTWNALDGNRSVEGFNLKGNPYEEADTLSYLKDRMKQIEPTR